MAALPIANFGYLADPLFSFLDNAGVPPKNGYIIACLAGTSTKVVTYSSWDGSPNFNPVQIPLDSAGRMVNPAIVEKDKVYKILICDASHGEENPIKTVDNVVVAGASVTNTGNIVQGLNSVSSDNGLVEVRILGANSVQIVSKITVAEIATKAMLENEESRANAAETRIESKANTAKTVAETAAADVVAERSRAEGEEERIENEYKSSDNALQSNITTVANLVNAETSRATTAEERIEAKADSAVETAEIADTKVDNLREDLEAADSVLRSAISTETAARIEAVDSVSSAVQIEKTERRNADLGHDQRLHDLEALVPAEASANNQLADKEFVARTYPAFTPVQLDALNSGIDVNKVAQIEQNRINIKNNAEATDAALANKADKSTTYTKTEVDNKVSPKADKTYVDNMLGNVEALLAAI